ncbi:MAG: hypothetical protein KKC68_01020 [Candidatus Thermoplasmatota archaeon]|nr:hypothetical protein [Candidatus Thermoplasmatota archaeon]MBU1940332.1 hypothetical protein [Candidatus Thermoplasmatota archaeon]
MKYETWIKKCEQWKIEHPELPLPSSLRFYVQSDKFERFVDELEKHFQDAEGYGIANIETLPKIHYDRAVKLCISHVAYWLNQLKQLGGQELIDELIESTKNCANHFSKNNK